MSREVHYHVSQVGEANNRSWDAILEAKPAAVVLATIGSASVLPQEHDYIARCEELYIPVFGVNGAVANSSVFDVAEGLEAHLDSYPYPRLAMEYGLHPLQGYPLQVTDIARAIDTILPEEAVTNPPIKAIRVEIEPGGVVDNIFNTLRGIVATRQQYQYIVDEAKRRLNCPEYNAKVADITRTF